MDGGDFRNGVATSSIAHIEKRIMTIPLGAEVLDPITGLKGIAVCKTEWMYGCVRVGVQAKVRKDGSVPDIHYVDEPQLELITKLPKKRRTGPPTYGDRPDADSRPFGEQR